MMMMNDKNYGTNLLSARSANVGAKHNFVGTLAVHVLLVQFAVEDLDISASAVNVLFMFYCELDY